ncbi:MAG: NAD(+) synthase, partial [Oscillospiraceae bacterium]|nr:NAD(+) synthase [Oscillospiraceae bacterium]
MKHGFLKVAAASPAVRVGDLAFNTDSAARCIARAEAEGIALLVLPELHLTAYTCGDLFFTDTLLTAAEASLLRLCDDTAGKRCVVVVGVPLRTDGKLYNCAAVLHDGAILGIVPKSVLPNHGGFNEARRFTSGEDYSGAGQITLRGRTVPFGLDLLFRCEELPSFVLGVEVCEDLWAPET